MPESESVLTIETPAASGEVSRGWRLGFWSLIVTQFQGAFSDNALKWLVSFLLLGMGLEQGEARSSLRLGRASAFRHSFPAVFDDGRLPGRSLQQALGDRWSEGHGDRRDGYRAGGPRGGESLDCRGCALSAEHSSRSVWPLQVRPLARVAPGKAAVLGQRRPRVRNFSCEHRGHHGGRPARFDVPRAPGLVRNAFHCARHRGIAGQSGHCACPGGESGKDLSLQLGRRPLDADQGDAQRPRAVAGGAGQCVFLVPGFAASPEYRPLRHGHSARRRNAHQSAPGGPHAGNRRGQLRRWISLGRQDRVRLDSARLDRHHGRLRDCSRVPTSDMWQSP